MTGPRVPGVSRQFYVGRLKGVGRVCQQAFIGTYSHAAFVKLYDRKNALVAADLLNDRVVPFLEEHVEHFEDDCHAALGFEDYDAREPLDQRGA